VEVHENSSETVGMDVFLPEASAAHMAAAKALQPEMIRISKEVAVEMLARGEADIYRLNPVGAEKLATIEATRLARNTGNCEVAIKREDIAVLDKWAERAAQNIMRQSERSERDKSEISL
jgi:hypothetical protein